MIPLPKKPKLIHKDGNKAVFEIEGLYPGYGVTLSNALRRVILSSLPGAAITSVKIKGVDHEFSTIANVLEDVVEILLNLKQVRFKLYGDEPQTAKLSVRGEKEVKASDIKAPSQLEVINKDAHIATVTSKKGEIEMELQVERGLGYVPSEQRTKEKSAIGSIALDAIFIPIKRANFTVENMRVGDRTDFNRLRLEIETDGSITSEDALSQAAEILISHFQICVPEVVKSKEIPKQAKKEGVDDQEEFLKIKIEDAKFSTRTKNALIVAGIKTMGGLVKKSEEDLARVDGLGGKAIKEIKKVLKKQGLELH